jgi:hypothetical protein
LPPPPADWKPAKPPRGRRNAAKALALLIVLMLLLSAILFSPAGKMMLHGLTGGSYPSSSEFVLKRTISIHVQSGKVEYACDLPVPRDIPGSDGLIQDVISVTESPPADHAEKHGYDWMAWSGTEEGTAVIEVEYSARVSTVVWDMDSGNSGMAADIPGTLDEQCDDEWEILDQDGDPTGEYMIWPSNPDIQAISADLTSPGRTVYENVRSVYDFMRDNFEYRALPDSGPKACLDTLEDRDGDCDDQSLLLITLLRAAGIPSWLSFGVLYDDARGQWGAHAWAEVYMPLDDGTGGSVTVDVVNSEFLVRNCNRLEEWKSDGSGEHLGDYYHTLTYNYTLSGPHQQPPDVTLADEYEGEYEASSDRVHAFIGVVMAACASPSQASRKVF